MALQIVNDHRIFTGADGSEVAQAHRRGRSTAASWRGCGRCGPNRKAGGRTGRMADDDGDLAPACVDRGARRRRIRNVRFQPRTGPSSDRRGHLPIGVRCLPRRRRQRCAPHQPSASRHGCRISATAPSAPPNPTSIGFPPGTWVAACAGWIRKHARLRRRVVERRDRARGRVRAGILHEPIVADREPEPAARAGHRKSVSGKRGAGHHRMCRRGTWTASKRVSPTNAASARSASSKSRCRSMPSIGPAAGISGARRRRSRVQAGGRSQRQ